MEPQTTPPSGETPDGASSDNKPTDEVQVNFRSDAVVPAPGSTPAADSAPDTPALEPAASSPDPIVQPTPEPTPPVVGAPVMPTVEPVAASAPTATAGDSMAPAPGVVVGGMGQPMTQMPPMPMNSADPGSPSGVKKRWLLPAIIATALLMLGAGGYVFGIYLPNTPGVVYLTSLKETGDAIDTLINYTNTASTKNYKSYSVSGSINSTGTTSFDATINGSGDTSGNTKFAVDADLMGEKLNANVDTVHVSGSNAPDVYLQVTGIKPVLDTLGMGSLDNLDGQWIGIDHTLVSSSLATLNQGAASATKSSQQPSLAQVVDAANKVQTVNKTYLFAAEASTAVLTNEKYIGKATVDGRSTYHYRVGYNKAHLEAYLSALTTALDSSSLNTWSKLANSGQSLSQELDINSIKTSVANANSNYEFDMWVDTQTKLPHTVQFVDPSDNTSAFTISEDYTGGTTYPFGLGFVGKDSTTGDPEKANLNFSLDSSTDKVTMGFNVTEGSSVNMNANVAITPSTHAVQVTPPVSAEPIANVLTQLGLSGSTGGL